MSGSFPSPAFNGATIFSQPVATTDAANKAYVDLTAGGSGGPFFPLSGGTVSGGGFFNGGGGRAGNWAESGTFTGGTYNSGTIGGTWAGTPTFSGAVTHQGTSTLQGNVTAGTGSGTWRVTSGTTGNWVFQLGGATSVWSITESGGTNLMQFSSSAHQVVSNQQFILQANGSNAPVWSGTIAQNSPMLSTCQWTGTSPAGTNIPLFHNAQVNCNIDATASNAVTLFDSVLSTGVGFGGNIHNYAMQLNMKAPTLNTLPGQATYSTMVMSSYANFNDNGSGLTPTTSHGNLESMNTIAELLPGCTFWHSCAGYELDIGIDAGSSAMDKIGLMIAATIDDAVQGARDDVGLTFIANGGPNPGWRQLIGVGRNGSHNPMDPTNGWVITFTNFLGVGTIAGAGGFDFTNFVPVTAFMRGNNFLLDPTGNWTANSYKVGANQVVGARDTGWAAMTGTPDKATAFATSTVTLAQLAGRVMSLQAALTTHGLIGT